MPEKQPHSLPPRGQGDEMLTPQGLAISNLLRRGES
jgi:hypothetical protein